MNSRFLLGAVAAMVSFRSSHIAFPFDRDTMMGSFGSDVDSPSGSLAAGKAPRRGLIGQEPWDHYDLESLLPLKETYRENTEFGFLIHHYWIPATVLTFRQSARTTLYDATIEECELEIERRMARCRSNECLWREKVFQIASDKGNGDDSHAPVPSLISEALCSYDCYEQTYTSDKPILFAPRLPTRRRRPAVGPSIISRCSVRRGPFRLASPGMRK
jgi:hypothetical protein